MEVRKRIHVSGMVQGVGFRPYVYRLAGEHRLSGHIANNAAGVVIEIQGPDAAVAEFVRALPASAPPLALITDMQVAEAEIESGGGAGFTILPSEKSESVRTLILPDIATCDDCLRELFDPADRRYLYPFINCTNCGPRFTIIRGLPYDRPQTSMSVFPMCTRCLAEYEDPRNRRFHAQPNACPDCGPHVGLSDRSGHAIASSDPIASTVELLRAGSIVAIKGLGGFHLAADAAKAAAVDLLRTRKRRVEKPFAVMVADLAAANEMCELTDEDRALLAGPRRPIVLAPRKASAGIADCVAPFQSTLGIFLPYTPLHHVLLRKSKLRALVMTSGNLSEEPIAIANDEAIARLGQLADAFLVHNREILIRSDDSVVRRVGGRTRQLRRSRGYVPAPVFLHREFPAVLAVGGELKNTVCVLKGRQAFLSQHVGDLENAEAFGFFRETIEHMQSILEIRPPLLAYDLHPDYFSTRWALAQTGVTAIGVQHHHAHIASCMAENHLDGRVIGIALDGTGYGTDGCVWGGEVLVADYTGFTRAAHLAYVPMPGAAAAIREPWRMAVSYLASHFGEKFADAPIEFTRWLDLRKANTLLIMMKENINSPLTSSCGRLFDAVAALIGVRRSVNYEGQAAIELEAAMGDCSDTVAYPVEFRRAGLLGEAAGVPPKDACWEIGTRPMFDAIVRDLEASVAVPVISRRFHNGIVEAFARAAELVRDQSALHRVCLSGGSFQNAFLLEQLTRRLAASGFDVYSHSEVPAGDGGLSLGQAVVAASTHL
jgi:hydrogenase maturation protein HypF